MSAPFPPPAAPAGPHAAPPSTSLRGPVALTVAGAVLCVATVVIAVLVGRTFLNLLPTDLLTSDGQAGPGVVAEVSAPGQGTAQLEADTSYVVLLATSTSAGGDHVELEDDVVLVSPDGNEIVADRSPGVNLSASRDGTAVRSVGAFRTQEAGQYTVTAPPVSDGGTARVLLAPDQAFGPFFVGIFGSVFGVFAAIATAITGMPMLVIGIVWWRRRAGARAAGAAGPGAPGHPATAPR
ncbi:MULTISPECIES: hypothetical protein [unclassified Actinotalea]|uniref:hypothetical protein n=1 Tax=unclassified Actinotalea TaxID=2638618 RepID=UPI0015F5686B|nr:MULTISPECIES: hypothetical protein [unclassified Actinotalea]